MKTILIENAEKHRMPDKKLSYTTQVVKEVVNHFNQKAMQGQVSC